MARKRDLLKFGKQELFQSLQNSIAVQQFGRVLAIKSLLCFYFLKLNGSSLDQRKRWDCSVKSLLDSHLNNFKQFILVVAFANQSGLRSIQAWEKE